MIVKIMFRGLCGFVPHIDGNRMMVLMPDITSPSYPQFLPHSPGVEYDPEDRIGGDVARHRFLDKISNGDVVPRGLWLLDREHLEIWPGGRRPTESRLEIDNGDPDLIKPGTEPTKENSHFFAWVPSAVKTLPEASVVDDQVFGEHPSPKIIARMLLVDGKIQTKKYYSTVKGCKLFRFSVLGSKKDSDHVQAVAEEVELSFHTDSSFVDIVSVSLDRDERRFLRLQPKSPDEAVEFVVQNMEINEAVAGPKHLKDLMCDDEYLKEMLKDKTGRHDALLYNLSLKEVPLENRPVPHEFCEPEDGSGSYFERTVSYVTKYGVTIVSPSPPCSPKQFARSDKF